MAEQAASSNKLNIFWGLFMAAIGAFIVAGASGLFGASLHPTDGTPQWVGIFAGGIFLAGGLALVVQSLAAAKPMPDGSMSPDAPLWMQWISFALCMFIVGSFVAIFAWIAFGSGERHFSGGASFGGVQVTGTFSGHANEWLGRAAFGFGAVFAALMFIAFLISGARRLLRRDKSFANEP
jgi:hypothetical protein